MVRLRVIAPGARTMVQDLGFVNARGQGVPAGGVLDRAALRLVNALLGNPEGTEALEVALSAPVLKAEGGAVRLALSGTLSGVVRAPGGSARPVAGWTATTLAQGEELHLDPPERNGIGLIGLAGGLDLPLRLGSRSTSLRAGFGGFEGRCLRAGDQLCLRRVAEDVFGAPDLGLSPPPVPADPIRVVPGPQAAWFAPAALERFFATPYRITPQYDRMGMRLAGAPLSFAPGLSADIISDGIAPGAIQVPGNGEPIILLADAQTTGGYPKIGCVISADLPRLAAHIPGDSLRFRAATVAEAEALGRAHRAALDLAVAGIAPLRRPLEDAGLLLAASLIGGAIDMARPDHFPGHLFDTDLETDRETL